MKYLLLPVVFLFWTGCANEQATEPPPITIPVYEVKAQDIVIREDFVGQVYGHNDIDIRARVSGFVDALHFEEGSMVRKGQLLYEIDPQPFEQNVAQKKGILAQAKTGLAKAENDLKRIRPLAEKNAVSQRDLDAAVAAYESALAEVDAAEAGVRLANIELGYTRIYAPLNGVIGKTEADVSDFVGQMPNPVILNTVSEIDSMKVEFFITENQYLEIIRNIPDLSAKPDTARSLTLILSDGSVHPYRGKVDFLNREINQSTGTILIQATFPNPDRTLRPGQSVIIRVESHTIPNGIMVPQRAVTELQGIHSVAVFKEDNTIENRRVDVGEKKGNMWVILEGLQEGDKVVLENVVTRGIEVKFIPELTNFEIIE